MINRQRAQEFTDNMRSMLFKPQPEGSSPFVSTLLSSIHRSIRNDMTSSLTNSTMGPSYVVPPQSLGQEGSTIFMRFSDTSCYLITWNQKNVSFTTSVTTVNLRVRN